MYIYAVIILFTFTALDPAFSSEMEFATLMPVYLSEEVFGVKRKLFIKTLSGGLTSFGEDFPGRMWIYFLISRDL